MLGGVKRKIWVAAAEFFAQMCGNQFAVEAAVFDEDFVGLGTGYDHSGHVDSGDVRFQAVGSTDGTHLLGRKFDAYATQKIVIWMVASKGEDKVVVQAKRTFRSAQRYPGIADLLHGAVEVGRDFASLNAVLDVGTHPVLDVVVHLRSAMNEGDAGAVTPQIQRGFGGGIFASDYEHVGVVIRMGFAVVMQNFFL